MTVRYARAPSSRLMTLLAPGQFLSPLLVPLKAAGLRLDAQFREGDEVHLYCGQTRLLRAWPSRAGFRFGASSTYTKQANTSGLFRRWSVDEPGLGAALGTYLASVVVGQGWTNKEGKVQATWMQVQHPWRVFDREAALGYDSVPASTAALDVPNVQTLQQAARAVQEQEGWGKPKNFLGSNELDQLGIDEAGNLVLAELKWGDAGDVYWSPAQLVRYLLHWQVALPTVMEQVQALIDAKIALGLLPVNLPKLTGRMRPVVAWGEKQPSAEKLRRFRHMLAWAQAFVPPGHGPLEAWCIDNGAARPV